jgi:hypothetical protein
MDKDRLASFLLNVKDSSLQHVNVANEQPKKHEQKQLLPKIPLKKCF